MELPVQTLYRHSMHYLVGRALVLLTGLVSLPLYMRLLSVADYGILNLAQRVIVLATAFAKMGLQNSLMRFYEEHAGRAEDVRRLCSTVFFGALLGGLLVVACYGGPLAVIPRAWIPAEITAPLVAGSGLILIRALYSVTLGILRVQGRTVLFNAADVAIRLLAIPAIVILLLAWRRTPGSFLLGLTFGEGTVLLVLVGLLTREGLLRFSGFEGARWRRFLAYGLPLTGYEISRVAGAAADRVMMQYFLGALQLGYYAAAVSVATAIEEAIQVPLNLALVPIYMKLWTTEGAAATRRFLSQVFHYFVLASFGILSLTAVTARDLMILLGSAKYREASPYLPVLVGALFLYAATTFLNAGLMLHNRTAVQARLISYTMALRIALCFALLPTMGVWGAVLAALLSHAALVALIGRASLPLLPLHFDLVAWGKYLLAATAAFLLGWYTQPGGILANLAGKGLVVVTVYVGLASLLDANARQLLRSALGKLVTRRPPTLPHDPDGTRD